MATDFFRSIGVPSLLYIDDRHNGQLQALLNKGGYSLLRTNDARDNAAASSAIFIVAFHLVCLGYFLGLLKSILTPRKIVPYLGFLADSSREVFHLIPEKKVKFITFVQDKLLCNCQNLATPGCKMCLVLPGSPSCKAVYERNECCNFSGPALSKGGFVG